MSNILNSFFGLLSNDNLNTVATNLQESPENIQKAGKTIAATMLGGLLEKGNDPHISNLLSNAGNQNSGILSSLGNIFSGNMSGSLKEMGGNFLSHLFGDKIGAVSNLVSSASGVKTSSAFSLMGMLAPVFAGFLGNKMKTDGTNLNGLLSTISSEKSSFLSYLPEGLAGIIGIGSLSALGSKIIGGVGNTSAMGSTESRIRDAAEDVEKKSGAGKWIGALILLSVLLLMAYFIKSCKTCNDSKGLVEAMQTKADTPEQATTQVPHESIKVKLPSGLELNAYKGGIEEQMVEFLKSGDLDKMSEEELKNKWFSFDNINYEFGSSNKITPESQVQLDNLVAILKEFKTVKIKLGAYTDKKGDAAANLKMSQGRANDMKKRLTVAGVGAQVAGAEGYGAQFATIDASKSDEERSVDRKISLRFTK